MFGCHSIRILFGVSYVGQPGDLHQVLLQLIRSVGCIIWQRDAEIEIALQSISFARVLQGGVNG